MQKGNEFRYLHGDHLGSIVMETSLSGAVITDQKYYAFGRQRDSGPVTTDHRFTGQKLDGSGLMYYACPELAEGTPAITTRSSVSS